NLKDSGQALSVKRERCLHKFMDQCARRRTRERLDLFQKLLDPRTVRIHLIELLLCVIRPGGPESLRRFSGRQKGFVRGSVHFCSIGSTRLHGLEEGTPKTRHLRFLLEGSAPGSKPSA